MEADRERDRESECVCVCVYVCVRERERDARAIYSRLLTVFFCRPAHISYRNVVALLSATSLFFLLCIDCNLML